MNSFDDVTRFDLSHLYTLTMSVNQCNYPPSFSHEIPASFISVAPRDFLTFPTAHMAKTTEIDVTVAWEACDGQGLSWNCNLSLICNLHQDTSSNWQYPKEQEWTKVNKPWGKNSGNLEREINVKRLWLLLQGCDLWNEWNKKVNKEHKIEVDSC